MRVIAGECKGHPLKAVPGTNTRPTTDKVKESLFSMIGPFFQGGTALDLFAGSGGLAIEALSRGFDHAILIDQAPLAIKTIKENLAAVRLSNKASVYRNEATRALKLLHKQRRSFELVFLDPPYKNKQLENLLIMIEDLALVKNAALVVCEHDKSIELPEVVGKFNKIKAPVYGITVLSIYKFQED